MVRISNLATDKILVTNLWLLDTSSYDRSFPPKPKTAKQAFPPKPASKITISEPQKPAQPAGYPVPRGNLPTRPCPLPLALLPTPSLFLFLKLEAETHPSASFSRASSDSG